MASEFGLALFFIILGGVMEGSFSLPLKYTPKWAWENTWGSCSLIALIVVPWPLALLTVPNLSVAFHQASSGAIWAAIVFGAGWGIGGIFFGLGLDALGLSLGLSLIMGLVAITGSLIPLLMQHPEELSRAPGMALMAGIAVMIAGLVVCSRAGRMKEHATLGSDSAQAAASRAKGGYARGVALCIAAGLLSSLVNFALIFGADIAHAAGRQGIGQAAANNALWALVFTANYVVNAGYCAFLAARRNTFRNFFYKGTGIYWIFAVAMGLVWAAGIAIYGAGASMMGEFGAIFGFPIMVISAILAGNVLGFFTGEWTGSGAAPKRMMAAGVLLLVIATGVIAYSNRLAA